MQDYCKMIRCRETTELYSTLQQLIGDLNVQAIQAFSFMILTLIFH